MTSRDMEFPLFLQQGVDLPEGLLHGLLGLLVVVVHLAHALGALGDRLLQLPEPVLPGALEVLGRAHQRQRADLAVLGRAEGLQRLVHLVPRLLQGAGHLGQHAQIDLEETCHWKFPSTPCPRWSPRRPSASCRGTIAPTPYRHTIGKSNNSALRSHGVDDSTPGSTPGWIPAAGARTYLGRVKTRRRRR